MRTNGIIRSIDKMGRVVIPKEIRAQLNLRDEIDSVEICVDRETIILRKHQPACIFCDSLDESIKINGYNVCKNCIQRIVDLKEEAK